MSDAEEPDTLRKYLEILTQQCLEDAPDLECGCPACVLARHMDDQREAGEPLDGRLVLAFHLNGLAEVLALVSETHRERLLEECGDYLLEVLFPGDVFSESLH